MSKYSSIIFLSICCIQFAEAQLTDLARLEYSFIPSRKSEDQYTRLRALINYPIKIKDKDLDGRLEGSGPFGAMCTHRVKLTDQKEVDKEVLAWLKEAYEKAG